MLHYFPLGLTKSVVHRQIRLYGILCISTVFNYDTLQHWI